MKIAKYLASAVGLLVALIVLVIVIFVLTFDANEYKQELSGLVEQQTGRKLRFEGDIGLSLYPALGMKLGAMSLSNAEGFGDQPMLRVEHVSASVDLLSILSMQPEIDQLVLDGLELNLHRNASGITNFDDLLAQPAASDPPPQAPSTAGGTTGADGSAPLASLAGSFAGLNIRNARLLWRDDSIGEEYRVQDLQLVTGRIALDTAFPLQLSLSAHSREALNAKLELEARVTLSAKQARIDALRLKAEAGGSMLPVDNASLDIGGAIDFPFESQRLGIKGFSLRLNSQGGVMQQVAATLAGEIGFDVRQQRLDIAVLDLAVDAEDPSLPKGRINAGVSAASAAMVIAANSLRLDDVELQVDGNRFQGFIHANDFTRPDVAFKLHSSRLDVDALMGLPEKRPPPPEQPETPAEPASQQPPADVQIALPMELLRKLRLDGQLSIDDLKVQYLTLTNLGLSIKANGGLVDVTPIEIDLYQGHNSASLRVDARGAKPAYAVSNRLQGFRIGRFLSDFMGKDPISGRSDLSIDLSTSGEWLSELKASLNGRLDVAISDGALTGFNLRHKIESARAKFRREAEPKLVDRKTDFSALTLSGQIKDGVFSSKDLNLQAPLVRVGGSGSVDIARETVDYRVDAKLVTTSKGQQGGDAEDLGGIPIPVAITGPWLQPDIDVQYDEMIKARLDAKKAAAKQKLEAEKARLQQKLEAEKQQKLDAEKARLEQQKQQAVDEQKARLEAQKKEAEQKARDKLQDKLKGLF